MANHPPAAGGGLAARSPAVEAALERSLFVIPSINGGSLLRRMLPTLRLPLHTVVVLDQGSLDDTEAVCRAGGVRCVQLGRPRTYTEAGNIGACMAREAGCDFLFLSNNDIAFRTDVGAELLAEMLEDPLLGIVAPSQIIVDEKAGQRHLAYRVEWHLDALKFIHDFRTPGVDVGRVEADLCELTCAAVRMSAIDEIGFLDDDFGFYHEDADFCFRLRRAGYSCAYLPRSQLEHYTTSTFSAGLSDRKRAFMVRNAELFARKHLGYGVGRLVPGGPSLEFQSGVNRHLPGYLDRFGLIELGRPALVRGELGAKPLDYLHIDIPPSASSAVLGRLHAYRAIVASSKTALRMLRDAGFEAVGYAPIGIETDLFHPWIAQTRLFDETTFLLYRPGPESLDAVLRAWALFRASNRVTHLVVVGTNVLGTIRQTPTCLRQWGDTVIADYAEVGIQLREISVPFSDEQRATLFRGVDTVMVTRQNALPDLAAALACGTLALFPESWETGAIGFASAMTLSGRAALDGAWTPDVDRLVARFHEIHDLAPAHRRILARTGLPFVRARMTWRSTCTGLSEMLRVHQEPANVQARLRSLRQIEEAALAADPDEMLFSAREVDEQLSYIDSAPRPARQPAPTPQLRPADARPCRCQRLAHRARRLKEGCRRVYAAWRTDGNRAAIHIISRPLKFYARALTGGSEAWLAAARWSILAVLGTLALFVAVSTALWQFRSTFAIPFGDQWSAVYEYFQFRAGQIGIRDLFAQSNEHRIFFPRLIMFADLRWFGGRNAFNVLTSDAFQIAHLALLLWMGRVVLAKSFAGWATAAFIVAAMLTGSQYENIYWGFQSCFVMVFFFASAALAIAATLPLRESRRLATATILASASICAVVSTFSMANGLLVWPLLVLAVVQRRAGPIAIAVVAASGAAAIFIYLHGYVSVGAHTPLSAALYNPLAAAGYFLAYLGAVIAPRNSWAAGACGVVMVLLLAALAMRRLTRRERIDGSSLFFWCIVLFMLMSAAATTLGRFEFGSIQALSPRYITPDAALWSATAILTLDAFRSRTARETCCMTAAVLTSWLALVNQPLSFKRMADHMTDMAVASDAVIAGVTDAATLAGLRSTPEAVGRLSALLKPQRLSVFGSREAGWMRQPVDKAFTIVDDASCLGFIDFVLPLGQKGSDGAVVAGWAWDGQEHHGPIELIFTDGGGTIVGFARGQLPRPDVPAAIPAIRSDRVGWGGFLSSDRGPDLRAYAILDDNRTVCHFGQ